jgi:glycosyltransferase involved in cell wall biosynthesis
MPLEPKISVLILTKNSGRTIKRTMESVKNFDEIIVVDAGSVDNTQSIVENYQNAKFIFNEWPGFIAQRNLSIEKAKYDWCFMIDSDEECTPELFDICYEVIKKPNPKAMYRVVRTEYFLGGAIENGFGKSDYQERLFQRSRVRYAGGNHHTHTIDGELIYPEHPDSENFDRNIRVLHDPDYGMDEWIAKFPRFSILGSRERIEKNKKVSKLEILITFPLIFLQVYRKSYLDGKRGFVISVLEAINRTMMKVYIYQHNEITQNKTSKEFIQKLP